MDTGIISIIITTVGLLFTIGAFIFKLGQVQAKSEASIINQQNDLNTYKKYTDDKIEDLKVRIGKTDSKLDLELKELKENMQDLRSLIEEIKGDLKAHILIHKESKNS